MTPSPTNSSQDDPAHIGACRLPRDRRRRRRPGSSTPTNGPGTNFTTISAAIAAAQPGDRILVRQAIYGENVVVNKAVTIVGWNATTYPMTVPPTRSRSRSGARSESRTSLRPDLRDLGPHPRPPVAERRHERRRAQLRRARSCSIASSSRTAACSSATAPTCSSRASRCATSRASFRPIAGRHDHELLGPGERPRRDRRRPDDRARLLPSARPTRSWVENSSIVALARPKLIGGFGGGPWTTSPSSPAGGAAIHCETGGVVSIVDDVGSSSYLVGGQGGLRGVGSVVVDPLGQRRQRHRGRDRRHRRQQEAHAAVRRRARPEHRAAVRSGAFGAPSFATATGGTYVADRRPARALPAHLGERPGRVLHLLAPRRGAGLPGRDRRDAGHPAQHLPAVGPVRGRQPVHGGRARDRDCRTRSGSSTSASGFRPAPGARTSASRSSFRRPTTWSTRCSSPTRRPGSSGSETRSASLPAESQSDVCPALRQTPLTVALLRGTPRPTVAAAARVDRRHRLAWSASTRATHAVRFFAVLISRNSFGPCAFECGPSTPVTRNCAFGNRSPSIPMNGIDPPSPK